ncbi:MmgE/PrpD family protein [Methanothermobacter sp. K4]|uniref:MmgE/PrpD family protein n=1 Tax=Methanothermobacter sp. K4 TaxID=2913262 RepID=UPI001EDA2CB2|nr:MmgE/PrpD family protein [Methanothermobacter sp. K4]MCG2828363.1 MmgE/PrpD family protein [Methanothermobacter sp. K4]
MMTGKLAEFVSSLSYRDLSPEIIERAEICLLDFLGVALRGSGERSGITALRALDIGEGNSTVIGHGRGSDERAALLNGIFAHNLDLDDGHRGAQLHPGACVIPAALSAAEALDAEFREFIAGVVAGYEVAIFMGLLANPSHRKRGFHTTGTCGTFGAAAAAASVMGLDFDETVNALGLAGTQAAGLLESDHAGSMGKHLHAGRAAQSGLISAKLASEGFTGAESIIEGKEGFLNAMCQPPSGIPETGVFHIVDVYLKRYPVCRHLHSALDCALEILGMTRFSASEIAEVLVETYEVAAEHDNYSPKTVEAVRQSLPVSLAIIFEKGDLRVEDLEMASDVRETASKIRIVVDPEMQGMKNRRPARVRVRLRDGSVHTAFRELPSGEPEDPYTWEDILEKFKLLNPGYRTDNLDILREAWSENISEVISEVLD